MKSRANLVEDVTEFLKTPPFSLDANAKQRELLALVNSLTEHHVESCNPYRKIVSTMYSLKDEPKALEQVPYIPVRLFKSLDLKSVETQEISKTMTSSGTSGQATSKIFLDRDTSLAQTRALTQIMSAILGKGRLPMVIIDSPSVGKDRASFTARGAGIRGFSMFGKEVIYALDDDMNLAEDGVNEFVELHSAGNMFLFGFTSIIWEHLVLPLQRSGKQLNIPNGVLLHGGGWKKLEALSVSNAEFNRIVSDTLGIQRVVNYYGMVEQTGSIFLECTAGYLHSSAYSEVIARHPVTFSPVRHGSEGLLQLISSLPLSYPGHSILTEDRGVIIGEDDCVCGWPGRYFKVLGRIKDAEIRGCSDTYGR